MFARLRFINGYSPIRPAGVARAFSVYIHGEIDPNVANYLLEEQAGPNGRLAQIGVDRIVIARELTVDPHPASEWQVVFSNEEGRVFHRRGPPISPVRSQASNESVVATRSNIDGKRNRVEADINVPAGTVGHIKLEYRPTWLRFGMAAAIVSMVILFIGILLGARRRTAS